MVRINVTEETDIKTWRDLRGALVAFHRQYPNNPLSNNAELVSICREWFINIGAEDKFDPSDPNKFDNLIEIIDGEIEAENEATQLHKEDNAREFDAKALDSQRLEILLEEYKKHQDLKAEELIEELRKNPALSKTSRQAIEEVIKRKVELQKEAINRGESIRMADLESDLQLTTERELIQAGLETDKAEKVAISAAEIAVKAETLNEAREEISKILKIEKIDSGIKLAVEEATVNKTAEVIVAIQEERIVDNFVEKLKQDFQISPTKEKEIRAAVTERLDLEIRESLPKANEKKVITVKGVTKAESLTDRVVIIVDEESGRDKIGLIAKEVEKEADRLIANKPEVVGIYRRVVIENEIKLDLVWKGEDVLVAAEKANYWGEFIYPQKREAEMVKVDEASIQKGQENGYEGATLKLAAKRAQVVTRLICSDKNVEQNVAEMLQHGEGVDNEYTDVARQLSKDTGARRSLEYIRSVVKFRERFDRTIGHGASSIGRLIKSEKLQQWGQNLLARIGTNTKLIDFSGAATTWFGWAQNNKLGMNWVLNKISDAWLGAGLKPIQFGGILEKIGGNNLLGLGKNVFSSGQILAKKTGINALGAIKAMGTKLFPKLAAGLGKAVLGVAAWPVMLLSLFDLKDIFKTIAYVVGGLFIGLLVIIPLLTLGPVSSLVPTTGAGLGQEINVGHVDEHGNPIAIKGPVGGLPGGFVEGECNSAGMAIAATYKQCAGPWSSTVLPDDPTGTVCSSGCGPTSVSMVVSTVKGNCTPDQMYYNPECGSKSFAGSGRGGTGVMQNVNALSLTFPGKISVTSCSSAQEIAKFVCAGNIVEVLADFFYNSSGGIGGHYFLAVGVNNGQIVVKDPYYPKSNPFDGRREFGSIYKVYNCILIKK